MELYDSHGINPELLKEMDKENVLKIKIPEDFYLKITDKHLQEKQKVERKLFDASELADTKKLYYDNEKLLDFNAKVLKVDNENVVLNQTAFYPRGGGAEPDMGFINDCKVYDVEHEENVIVHKVKNPNFKVGNTVSCKVDSKRRMQIVKHHTATHMINGAARKVLGFHIWQAGSKKDVDKAHLDITHYELLTEDQMKEIEKIANETIKKGLKVKKEILQRTEAENKYGFTLYQGGVVPEKMLRIISIQNYDAEACGGLHVDNTLEIEEVFIFNSRRIQDGIIRLEYVAGKDLVAKTKKELEEKKSLDEQRLKKKMDEIRSEKEKVRVLVELSKTMIGINYIDTEDMKELQVIGRKSVKDEPDKFSVLVGRGVVVGVRGEKSKVDIEKIVKEAAKIMGGSASGRGNEFKGGGPLKDKSKEAYEKLKNYRTY